MNRIVCIGNRYARDDDVGPLVFDRLEALGLPEGVALVEGGTAGLNLLRVFDDAARVVFVDAVRGFGPTGSVHVMDAEQVAQLADDAFDHASGLAYLLRMMPLACEGAQPDVKVIGVEVPAARESIAHATELALQLAVGGRWDIDRTQPGFA